MVSDEDLHTWREVTASFKELKRDNDSLEKNHNNTKGFIEKTKERNKNNQPISISQKQTYQTHSDFKLKKGTSLGLDRNANKKLKAGKYPIDLRVDLHGLNLEDAYFKLKDTIDYAFEEGYRLVLAITGKGLHSIDMQQTIKSSLQNWLSRPEISSKIIKYVDAHKKHGGKGAVYILLRRHIT